MKQIITVKGLKCSHCEAKVEQALSKINGVESAKADREKCQVEVNFAPETVSVDELMATIEDCGYEASL
ncbi:MAG: heavy-metal-associated domain-containing protein [Bacteroidales bacterium]|nr:heavy-metal-associated domain-containing protein [Bacteroidales bacterium]